jgi:hypothetical protein
MDKYLRLAPAKLEFLISESLRNKASYIFWVISFYGVLSRNFLGSTPKFGVLCREFLNNHLESGNCTETFCIIHSQTALDSVWKTARRNLLVFQCEVVVKSPAGQQSKITDGGIEDKLKLY